MRLLIVAALAAFGAALLSPAPGLAAGAEAHPHKEHWSWDGPFGTFDRIQLQRGFQVYKEVCSTCHGLQYLSYRNLGERGGPFQAVAAKDWQDKGETPDLMHGPGHGKSIVNPNDNPYVRAIAAQYTVREVDAQTGDEIERPARPADRFVYPYENEAQGRAANGGAYPPDLSVIIKARHGGADYVHALLTGYNQEVPAGVEPVAMRYWNPYFKGGWIGMPEVLPPERVEYSDGTEASTEQMAKDVVAFLTWASDPKATLRKQTGFAVLGYLLALTALLYLAYRHVWRNESH